MSGYCGAAVEEFCARYSVPCDGEKLAGLREYAAFLEERGAVTNLTSVSAEDTAVRHFADSLTLYGAARGRETLLDVGSGAGFPGAVIKLFCPDIKLTLLDSNGKKTDFLNALCGRLGISAEILLGRAEDFSRNGEYREKYDLVTARAVAPLNVLCEYCLPFARVGGVFAPLKGPDCENELEQAAKAVRLLGGSLREIVSFSLPDGSERRVPVIEKVRHTPPCYPRRNAKIIKSPL